MFYLLFCRSFKFNLNRGFPLLELLISISIIGLLTRIALPFYQNNIGRARYSEIISKLSTAKRLVEISTITQPLSTSVINTYLTLDFESYAASGSIFYAIGLLSGYRTGSNNLCSKYSDSITIQTPTCSGDPNPLPSEPFPRQLFHTKSPQTNEYLFIRISEPSNDPLYSTNNVLYYSPGCNNTSSGVGPRCDDPTYLSDGLSPYLYLTYFQQKWTIHPDSLCLFWKHSKLC